MPAMPPKAAGGDDGSTLILFRRLLGGLVLRRLLRRRATRRGAPRRRILDLDDHLDLDRNAARQRAEADRRAGVPAAIAEHLDEQIGAAVDDFGLVAELGHGIDHAPHLS